MRYLIAAVLLALLMTPGCMSFWDEFSVGYGRGTGDTSSDNPRSPHRSLDGDWTSDTVYVGLAKDLNSRVRHRNDVLAAFDEMAEARDVRDQLADARADLQAERMLNAALLAERDTERGAALERITFLRDARAEVARDLAASQAELDTERMRLAEANTPAAPGAWDDEIVGAGKGVGAVATGVGLWLARRYLGAGALGALHLLLKLVPRRKR